MTITTIAPQAKNLGLGHFTVSSMDFDDATNRCLVHTHLTSTNKVSGFHSQTKMLFYGGNEQQLAAPGRDFGCNQAPLFGAAHANFDWEIDTPPGTQAVGLSQFWHPHWPLSQIGDSLGQFFTSVGKVINDADQWRSQHGSEIALILTIIVVAGTVLCLSGVVPACAVSIVALS
jgi:hypothetical protein